jgi:spoIIIJ-associated protein
MASVEWVEAQGPTVETAVEAALAELGLESVDEAEVEVLEEGEKGGFLGRGGRDAVVRVTKREMARPRRQRSSRSSSRGGADRNKKKPAESADKPEKSESQRRNSSSRPRNGRRSGGSRDSGRPPRRPRDDDERDELSVEDQAKEIAGFLEGLLQSFGLDGGVESRIEEGIIYAEVVGEQTEALVGAKGSILQSTLELCRTVVQRKTAAGARIRLDIAGYAERRREALRIYTGRLAEKVIADGGEAMLEPMNAADRKVVHDSVAEIDGVRSYSEGEEPRRSVVIAAEE